MKKKVNHKFNPVFAFVLVFLLAIVFYKTVLPAPVAEHSNAFAAAPIGKYFSDKDAKKEIKTVDVDSVETAPFLELVNSEYAVHSGGYETAQSYGVVPAAASDIYLNPTALSALEKLFGAARERGYDGFYMTSGYRDYEEQSRLYAESADKSFVQPPDNSEHRTGLAADISVLGVQTDSIERTDGWKWVSQNAHKYGFILRYPADKTDITGISYEPWHFRYVGAPHAEFIYKHGLCYEEYIWFLRENGGYEYKDRIIIYAVPENNKIEVPCDLRYDISPDNTGGFIITVYLEK